MTNLSMSTAALLIALVMTLAPQAGAEIVCKDGYQAVNGAEISTPYCNDQHLAKLAQARGSKVTAAEIRNNPNTKESVCAFMGTVGAAASYCNDRGGDSGGR